MPDATDARILAQYEAFPYPERDPRDEAKRLIQGSPSDLREIDHWVFGAARAASLPFRALFAGGGTGDGMIMLAAQAAAAGRPLEITWLDRSPASEAIARARAAARGLPAITFVRASILDLPMPGLETFDYIDCVGVLHHLPDPAAGLAALVSVLAPGGGLGLMVYAPLGRSGVYPMQDALRLLAPETEPPRDRLDVARRVLRGMPPTNLLARNESVTDHTLGGDAGIFDLLLHSRDRAYTVPEFAALLAGAGLAVTAWVEPRRYDPALYLNDPKLRPRIEALDPLARAALAELVAGNMPVHIVYAHRAGEAPPPPQPAPGRVPVLRHPDPQGVARTVATDRQLGVTMDGFRFVVPLPPLAGAILQRVDGRRTIEEIAAGLPVPRARFDAEFAQLWAALMPLNRLLLAPPS
ncbi:MAG: class I SAM-dependent methyltransferase [Acetobacteraceae bacterium]|nr:class I SAM-dependent methyltransferase [Acetobacteraceae bacterium]